MNPSHPDAFDAEPASSESDLNYCFGYQVARRLAEEADAEKRALVWFVHGCAAQLGGFQRLAKLIPDHVPQALGTSTMQALTPEARRDWSRETAESVGRELGYGRNPFAMLAGEEDNTIDPRDCPRDWDHALELCRQAVGSIGGSIRNYCIGRLGTFDRRIRGSELLIEPLLREFRNAWNQRAVGSIAKTVVQNRVDASLDYAARAGSGITLIEGDPRTGKTTSAKAWVQANLSRARYFSMESTMTDSAFLADVNRALGNPRARNAIQNRLRAAIREVLDTRDLLLVIDEAQWLWGNTRKAVPSKITWLMTAVVNRGCPVALVVTPQFLADLGRFEKDTAWAAAQWKGRITHYERLPSTLPDEDIAAVARCMLPEGNAEAIRVLAAFASASPSYLHAIHTATTRARFLAEQDGGPVTTAHVRKATAEQLSLAQDLAQASATPARRSTGRIKSSPLPTGTGTAEPLSKLTAASRLQGSCSGVPEPLADRSRPVLLQT